MSPREKGAQAVARAVSSGQIPRASEMKCEACRKPAHDWHHHHGYDSRHLLDVTALCRSCHTAVHRGDIPEPRTGERRSQHLPKNMLRPRRMVDDVARGKTPRSTAYPEYWAWAAAWVAKHPCQVPSTRRYPFTPAEQALFREYEALVERLVPATWADIDLAEAP